MSLKIFPEGFDFQGHRGCRGLLPENTIPAFLKAIDFGVTTLEMDVVISKDKKVIVSHEPFMSHEICKTPSGSFISEKMERDFNIYNLEYDEIKTFDCGSMIHPRFQQQQKIILSKPLLEDVIDAAEMKIKDLGKRIFYNIEIKSTPEGDKIFHPEVSEFSDLLIEVLIRKKIIEYTTIQCFDVRPLQYVNKIFPGIKLSYLIENEHDIEENLQKLGFLPDIYSPEYILVDADLVKECKRRNIKILPWTINEPEMMRYHMSLGVDGIISDYPNLFSQMRY